MYVALPIFGANFGGRRSGEDVSDDLARNICKSVVSSSVPVGELFVVKPHHV